MSTSNDDSRKYGGVTSMRFNRCIGSTISSSTSAGIGANMAAAFVDTLRWPGRCDGDEITALIGGSLDRSALISHTEVKVRDLQRGFWGYLAFGKNGAQCLNGTKQDHVTEAPEGLTRSSGCRLPGNAPPDARTTRMQVRCMEEIVSASTGIVQVPI